MKDEQSLILEGIPDAKEVYRINEYRLFWEAPNGATLDLILTVQDAGVTLGPHHRYSCKARRADGVGPTATGNPDRTLEGALFNLAVHLPELDIETVTRGTAEMPERDIFGAFAREHSKYIYFLLAAAAGATVYALGELDGPLGAADTLAALAIASWDGQLLDRLPAPDCDAERAARSRDRT